MVSILNLNSMKIKDRKYVVQTIEQEGFEYVFMNYSNFEDIEDEEFHKLINEYKNSAKNLANYIGYKL